MLDQIWDFLVRFRTWVVNLVGVVLVILPDILSAPEVLAIIPEDYLRYVIAGGFLLNIWLRPRPASRKDDPEVQAKVAAEVEAKITGEPVSLQIKSAGEKSVTVATVAPKGAPA